MKTIFTIADYNLVDANKEPELILPAGIKLVDLIGTGTTEHFVQAVPYFIRKIYYGGNNHYIITELLKQFKRTGIVFTRPTIEIAIIVTTFCNLSCNNCNMLSNHQSRNSTITAEAFAKFIDTYEGDKADTMIRLTGGEPTILGSKLLAMIYTLHNAGFNYITVLTNGIVDFDFPDYVSVENSSKYVGLPPEFNTQFIAPVDLPCFDSMPKEVYAGGCIQADVCGYAYDQEGKYFPCPTGASIYKSLRKANLVPEYTAESLDEAKYTRHKFFSDMCKYCGMFKKGGYHSLDKSQFERTTEEPRSATWKGITIV